MIILPRKDFAGINLTHRLGRSQLRIISECRHSLPSGWALSWAGFSHSSFARKNLRDTEKANKEIRDFIPQSGSTQGAQQTVIELHKQGYFESADEQLERTDSRRWLFLKEVELASKVRKEKSDTIDVGGVARCLVRDRGWGVVTFNYMDNLNDRVRQAYECAHVAHTDEPIELAPVPITDQRITVSLENDFRHVPMSTKKALVEKYNNIIWGHSNKIVDSFCRYGDSFNRRIFATSDGTYLLFVG